MSNTENPKLQSLRHLCAEYLKQQPDAPRKTVYWLERDEQNALNNDTLARIGGAPIGVNDNSFPRREGKRMEHIFTLDLRLLPALADELPADAKAVSLFVANPDENNAYKPFNDWSKVVLLSEQDLTLGLYQAPDYQPYTSAFAILVAAIEIPTEAFDANANHDLLKGIKDAIFNAPAYVLGSPIWLQDPEHTGTFIAQFDKKFANINLGDMGVMYLFADTAFWQCY